MSEAVVPPLSLEEVPKPKRHYKKRRKKARRPRIAKIAGTQPQAEPVVVRAKPVVIPEPPRPRHGAPKAMEEVDRQLAAAISQKPAYHEQLANLFAQTAQTQQRLDRLNQQIQELVNLQRQLDGETGFQAVGGRGGSAGNTVLDPVDLVGTVGIPQLDPRVASMIPGSGAMFGEVPQGVSSIPARQPKPTTANAADQVKGTTGWE